jgi:hypothetical protein
MDDSRALEAVKAVFHIWEAIFDGRSLDLHDNGWRASGLKAPICDPDTWRIIGGHFTRGDHWLPPAVIRHTLQAWLPPVPDLNIPSDDDVLTRDDVRLALADLGLDLSTATIAAWHALGCAEETAGETSAKIAGWKHDQKKKLYADIALRFRPKPPQLQQFSAPHRPPRWRPDNPRWISGIRRLIDDLQAMPVTARSPRDQFNRAIVSRGDDYAEQLVRLSNSGLADLVQAGGRIAVQQQFIGYVHTLHGRGWRNETLCSPEKADTGIHAQVRLRAEKLIDEWNVEVDGTNPRYRHVEELGTAVVKRAVPQPNADRAREQEEVLLDFAVHDVLTRRGHFYLPELIFNGCIEAIDRVLDPGRKFRQEHVQPSSVAFGTFSHLNGEDVVDRRAAVAMMHDHIRETVDEAFRAEYLDENGKQSRNSSTATDSQEKPPDA